jgi:hypothetical protein
VFEQGALRDEQPLVEFALGCFERLTGHLGTVYLGQLHRFLRRGRERELVARLAPHLEREAARDEHHLAFALAKALAHRGHDLPELQEALRQAVNARLDSVSLRAIPLWLAAPGTRDDRAGRLVAEGTCWESSSADVPPRAGSEKRAPGTCPRYCAVTSADGPPLSATPICG